MSTELCTFITFTDPEVVEALSESPEGAVRDAYICACVKVGLLAMRAARGAVDADVIRNAGDRMIEQLGNHRALMDQTLTNTLSRYFDPENGLFQTRISNLTKKDGELSRLMSQQVGEVQHQFDALAALLSGDKSNPILLSMREILHASGESITSQFSLDAPDSALSRMVRELTNSHGELSDKFAVRIDGAISEFSLDKPDSALSRLVSRVEDAQRSITSQFSLDVDGSALARLRAGLNEQLQTMSNSQTAFQSEVVSILSGLSATKAAQDKSTTHGIIFETQVGETLRNIASPMGDIVEDCGTTTGVIRASKVGDFVIQMPPENVAAGARIVVEAKESKSYTLPLTLSEADEAMRNRSAEVCLFIHSARTYPLANPIERWGNTVLVSWDAESDPNGLMIRAGYLVTKALCVRESVKTGDNAACFGKIDKAIEVVRKQIDGFAEMTTSSETIVNGATKILNRARIMRGELEKQLEILSEEIELVRK